MIEIKNVTQIGTPREEDKIYIEHLAYARMREESYQEKRVFVLMGHTERMEGKYATFVEAVIPVREMEFSGIVPQWNNGLWNQVFQEVKRHYEDKIIVGWALDAKGMQPVMNPDLERVHREHFGGVHQLVLLMDSIEQDETFYIYKENKLVPKNGFFIYYQARKRNKIDAPVEVIDLNKDDEEKETESSKAPERMAKVEIDTPQVQGFQRGRYRQLLSESRIPVEKESGNGGLAIAVAMLVFVIAVGAYENRESIFAVLNPPSTEAGATEAGSEDDVEVDGTENQEGTEAGTKIPVEIVPGTEKSGE